MNVRPKVTYLRGPVETGDDRVRRLFIGVVERLFELDREIYSVLVDP